MKNFLLIFTLILIFLSPTPCYSNPVSKNILIICSYDLTNEWESSIIVGLSKVLPPNWMIKIEFIDSKYILDKNYLDTFSSLLGTKYENINFDCILTIDDEALSLVRENLFNPNSLFYETPVIFVGANNNIILTNEENKYINGIFEYQDNKLILDIIQKSNSTLKDLYLLTDNSIYSQTIENNIIQILALNNSNICVHIINNSDINFVINKCSTVNEKTSALYLCGSYFMNTPQNPLSSSNVINLIKSHTNTPIYTKIKSYVDAGAIGGLVNDGIELGKLSYNLIYNAIVDNKLLVSPTYNTFSIPYFNFDSIRKYNINPLILPENTVYINKGTFDLLLPELLQYTVWGISIFIFLLFIIFIYVFIKNKKAFYTTELLLLESMERNNIKTDFIITLSHELRTPLNIIINSSKLIKLNIDNSIQDNESYYRHLSFIDKNSNRLLKLINNLIDVSKIDSGYVSATFEMYNIVEVIEDATMSVVDLANSKSIHVIFDTDDEIIYSAIDKNKIERIMLNLLSNSIKFTTAPGEILVNILNNKTYFSVVVKDNGIGMSDDMKNHLFEKFKRDDPVLSLQRNTEGSGLGLFIVKGLVDLHKGWIDVSSIQGVGTTFTINIPLITLDVKEPSQLIKDDINNIAKLELSDID